LFKVNTNPKFYKRCFIIDNLQKHFYHGMVSRAPKKSIGWASWI
jgi:hypothetical protein